LGQSTAPGFAVLQLGPLEALLKVELLPAQHQHPRDARPIDEQPE
jgi:hypothetical protein